MIEHRAIRNSNRIRYTEKMNTDDPKKITLHQIVRGTILGVATEEDLLRSQAFEHIDPDQANRTGILYIHGYTSTPHSMRPLAEALLHHTYYTNVPLLAGHGTNPIDMGQSTYQDWYQSVKTAYLRMAPACDNVIVIGQSLGALLTTMLAHEFPTIDSVIMLVPAFYPPAIINLTPILSPLLKALQIKTMYSVGGDVNKDDAYEVAYNRIHVNAPLELFRACRIARKKLPQLKQPIVVIGSENDHVLSTDGIDRAYSTITSINKQITWLQNTYHVASLDNDIDIIINLIKQQIDKLSTA